MPKKKQILYPVFFMVLVTVVFTTLLAGINALTIDRIEELESLKIKRSILYAADLDAEESNLTEIYDQSITRLQVITYTEAYSAKINGEIKAYIYKFSGPGLWGTITGYIAVSPSFDEIIGIDFLSHSETPGLGGRISETWYKEQFRGISLTGRSDNYVSYSPAADSNVDAVTGATLTSESVRKIFNESIREFIESAKGEL